MNRPLLKQALDALIDSVDDSRDVLNAHLDNFGMYYRPERVAAMRRTVTDGDAAIAALEAELAKPEPEPVAWLHTAKYKIPGVVQPTWLSFHPKDKHSQSAAPLYAAPTELNEIERLYKNALKREFELSQALKVSIDSNLDKLMGMSDEQIRALAGFEGHHPDDLAALARQTFEIALLKNKQRNCSRHPDAPHGIDGYSTPITGRYVCLCENWKPGEAS